MKKILIPSFAFFLFFQVLQLQAATPEMERFLDKVSNRLDSLDNQRPHTVEVTTIIQEMDRHWHPKKETVIQKLVTKKDTLRSIKIIKAILREKGKEKDITQKVIQDQQKKKKNGGMQFNAKGFFPFSRKNRVKYDFSFMPDTTINNKVLKVLAVRAQKPGEGLFNGTYFIDSKEFNLISLTLHPSKNPKMVKAMKMRMNFAINDFGNYVVKDSETIAFAQFLLKKYRYKIIEKYENYKFLDEH
ncbi:MAG: hypothetical protein GWP06_03585 [Actinobacteria bacterium]|nr:hypothetical protein [Actinomycetota bacterium]